MEWERNNNKITEIEAKLKELRQINEKLKTSSDDDFGGIMLERYTVKEDMIVLVANQITKLINDR